VVHEVDDRLHLLAQQHAADNGHGQVPARFGGLGIGELD